ELQARLDALNKFRNALDQRTYSMQQDSGESIFTLGSGDRYTFVLHNKKGLPNLEGEPQGFEPSFLSLSVTSSKGQKIVDLPSISIIGGFRARFTDSDFQQLVINLIGQTQGDLAELLRRQGTLSGASPEVWSYWDFFYFSAISQTTVGYGDVL